MSTSPAASFDPRSILPSAQDPPRRPTHVIEETEKQWMFTDEELANPPSVQDGMDPAKERETRLKGLHFIMQVGIMIKLPQLTLSAASIFFNRYLMRNSLVPQTHPVSGKLVKPLHHYQIAGVALFLATKTTETPRKLKDLIVACCRVAQKNPSLQVAEDSKDYWKWRDSLLSNEGRMLKELEFDTSVTVPHHILKPMLKKLGQDHNHALRESAWAFLNDSAMTHLSLRFNASTVAAAALYTASRRIGEDGRFLDDSNGRPWWVILNVELRDIKIAVNTMAELYEQDPEKLCDAGNATMYSGLRTPLDGDEDDAKTRMKRSAIDAFGKDENGASQPSPKRPSPTKDRAGPNPPDHKSTVRQNEDEGDTEKEASPSDGRTAQGRTGQNANGGPSVKADDAGSEEGEVEE